MGVDADKIKERERECLLELVADDDLVKEIAKAQKLDEEFKICMALLYPPFRDPNSSVKKQKVSDDMNALFVPKNWKNLMIYSSLFLRFPDLSPLHPFRRITDEATFIQLRNVSDQFCKPSLSA